MHTCMCVFFIETGRRRGKGMKDEDWEWLEGDGTGMHLFLTNSVT